MRKPKNGVVEFKDEGVVLNFGLDSDNIRVEKKSGAGVRNKSFVINVKVKEKVDNKDKDKTKFEPPLQLKVYYDKDDLTTANTTEDDIKLYYLDPQSSIWVEFTAEKHKYKKEKKPKNDWLGHGLAMEIREWPDPVIAWGQ